MDVSTWILVLLGCAVLSGCCALAPLLDRLSRSHQELLESAAGGLGLAYVFLYLMVGLASRGSDVVHALLPIAPAPHQTLFSVLLISAVVACVANAAAVRSARPRLGYAFLAGTAVVYDLLAGMGLVEEAYGGKLALALYVLALGLHLGLGERHLAHQAKPVDRRWTHLALVAAPLVGGVVASWAHIDREILYVPLAAIAGGMVVNVLTEELPRPGRLRPLPFLGGALGYAFLIMANWRL